MKLRLTWLIVEKAVDGAFALAMAIDRGIDNWKARKPKGLPFKEVQRINDITNNAGREARSRAKTVVLPRKDER